VELLLQEQHGGESLPLTNTTIGVIATDASLTKEQVNFLAGLSHDGLALAIRPCHTIRDGDTMFAMATGRQPGPLDITVLGAAAVEVTAQAVLRAVEAATGLGGVPAVRELPRG
jgi:L-aminopeptidase/D-esterase-like protein